MPVTSRHFFGRDDTLNLLDSFWSNQKVNLVTLVAWGGVGKTALMNAWLGAWPRSDPAAPSASTPGPSTAGYQGPGGGGGPLHSFGAGLVRRPRPKGGDGLAKR